MMDHIHSPVTADVESNGAANGAAGNPLHILREKIEKKEAVIGVAGMGYVGLPLAMAYAKQGFHTIGIDLDPRRIKELEAGRTYIQDVPDEEVGQAVRDGLLKASDNYSIIGETDIVFICVPTPVTMHKDPDTRFIESASRSIAEQLRPGQLIILKSTTFPNTTQELVQPILDEAAAEKDMVIGRDYFLAFSPERVDPGNLKYTTENTPVVVGGVTPSCSEIAKKALEQIVAYVHPVSSPGVAEMEKLLENIFRSVNIALVNELARLCDRMGGISIWEVVEAAATKPFGFMPFYPGPGLGGHCIPIDPYYLSWLARKYDFETSFITLAARTNEEMPFYASNAVMRAIAEQPVLLDDAKVLVLGVAFKRDVDDTRHAPALKVIEILRGHGVKHIAYSDPHVAQLTVQLPKESLELESVELTDEALQEYNVVVILTDHTDFPYDRIAEKSKAVIDTRNALKHINNDSDNISLLGGGRF